MKTAERAHTPSKLWERIRLSKNYTRALEQIDQHLLYWHKFLIHKCKQRLTRLTQVAITERRLALREDERHYVGVAPKVKRREATRERKALAAAKIEKSIEKELLERLKSGAYGDKPLNVDEKIWKKVLGHVEDEEGVEQEQEEEEDWDSEMDEEDESDVGEVEYVEDDGEDEFVDVEDLERWLEGSDSDASSDESAAESESELDSSDDEDDKKRKKKKETKDEKAKKRRARVEVEYEEEPLNNSVSTHA